MLARLYVVIRKFFGAVEVRLIDTKSDEHTVY
jgi:hypothetical protein